MQHSNRTLAAVARLDDERRQRLLFQLAWHLKRPGVRPAQFLRRLVQSVPLRKEREAAGRVGGTTVVADGAGRALYFSKRLVPHLPNGALDGEMSPVRLHVGVYAYRPEALAAYAATPVSELEMLEGLEQLRFLVAGIPIAVVEVETPAFALRELNNPEDVEAIEAALAAAGLE